MKTVIRETFQLHLDEGDGQEYPIGAEKESLESAICFRDLCIKPRYTKHKAKRLHFRISKIQVVSTDVDDSGNEIRP